MKTFLIYTFSVFLLLISACSKDKIPGVYRIDIQQGNDVTQDMLNKLKPDMTKSQVAFIMGTPLVIDTFHPDRWDYIYSFHPGNGKREQRRITLFFVEDKLDHIEGDTRIVAREDMAQTVRTDKNVVVPLNDKKTGFFQGIMNSMRLGNDEPDVIKTDKAQPQDTTKD
ncbi:MAG: outer membrane protein assembly factor BamE [Gammaproteobacteria bacterium]|nr:outer membrane protein assembly factor BamE [Gammaproteobacteria bacterium]